MIFAIIALLTIPILGNKIENDMKLDIKIHQVHPGLYYNEFGNVKLIENKWHLIMFYNLSTYWAQCSKFTELINAMRPSCQKDYCSHTLEEIQQYEYYYKARMPFN